MNIMTLILALIAVESSGNDNAIGDGGLAYGCLQLHACYVADAAEYAGEDWTHEDAFDRETSIKIVVAYMDRYATEKRLGRTVTIGDIARIHNGGPAGYKKKSTLKYWDKVEAELISRGAIASHN
jgi:soluble lytic murein transglycosylase-like protein